MANSIQRYLAMRLVGLEFDVCFVDCGEWISSSCVRMLGQHARFVLNYNIDDPFGGRDGPRWYTWRRALPEYDLYVTVRPPNVEEAIKAGAKRVLRVWMACDEVAHAPRIITKAIEKKWSSEVVFIGTWMPERGPFLVTLIRAGLPLAIWGNRWQKAPEWELLKPYWRGGVVEGDDYAYAIQCAKVVLGLLSKGNRDLHTTRTAEVPFLNSVLCAEDTCEHRSIFGAEPQGAWLFSDAKGAIAGIGKLLDDPRLRNEIADAGRNCVVRAGLTNQQVMTRILDHVAQVTAASQK